jgi:hypothetical protein
LGGISPAVTCGFIFEVLVNIGQKCGQAGGNWFQIEQSENNFPVVNVGFPFFESLIQLFLLFLLFVELELHIVNVLPVGIF